LADNLTGPEEGSMSDSASKADGEIELAALIVKTLNLDLSAEDIDPETPLFGEGLGLDSIDVLEIALAISQTYGVQLRSDDANNTEVFRSLRNLNREIQRRRSP
jgi:acyl carrier protein